MSGRVASTSRRVLTVLGFVALYLVIWLGITLLSLGIGIRILWGPISIDQMMMNLVAAQTDGGGGSLVWTGIFFFGILPVVLTLAISVWRFRRRRKGVEGLPAFLRLPAVRSWVPRTVAAVTVAAVVVGGTTAFGTSVHVVDYIKAANSPYTVDQYYQEPEVVSADGKRNLVMIYLESGEETLSDTDLFEKDPFVPLKDVTREQDGWQSIDNFHQYDGGGWTMAGLAGTQCGVPLRGTGIVNGKSGLNAVGENIDSYLGGLTCTGDILKEQGYRNVFMGGAASSFAAKDRFLASHGYDEQYGLDDWRANGEPDDQFRDDWGLSDKRLMANAKDEIDMLHADAEQTGQPFNLSLLTVDTHEPVHLYDYCDVDTENDVTAMFECSMNQVADFVTYMGDQGYLDDTAVMIMGDHVKHLGSSNAFQDELSDHPNRTIFNRFLIPDGDDAAADTSTLRDGVDQLNMMPTILEAAGLQLKGRQAGLGVSAFSSDVPAASAQGMDPDPYRALLQSRSPEFYNQAWEGEDLEQR